jgi:hypothetical protein
VELFRYNKPGARIAIFSDRLEMTTGVLLGKKSHTVPLRAVTGVSVEGFGGSTLRVHTPGGSFALGVGVGVGEKIRQRILTALHETDQSANRDSP